MPIKQSAFGGGESPAEEPAPPKPRPAKRSRRKKEELINDVVVPKMGATADEDEKVDVKFTATGTKGERPWRVAVELFREDKVEFVTKDPDNIDLKYAVMKMDREREAGEKPMDAPDSEPVVETEPADPDEKLTLDSLKLRYDEIQQRYESVADPVGEEAQALDDEREHVRQKIIEMGGEDPIPPDLGAQSGKSGEDSVPPEADIGDEVTIGTETYRVGHGGKLTSGPIEVDGRIAQPKRRWQRELGTGGNGSWEVREVYPDQEKPASTDVAKTSNGEVTIERQVVDPEMREITPGVWKVGTGVLEKIGLPEYSSLQVGPNTMSTAVIDDGRRTKTRMPHGDQREIVVPTAVIEAYAVVADTVEYVTSLQRRHLVSFLEAAKPGSTQPG